MSEAKQKINDLVNSFEKLKVSLKLEDKKLYLLALEGKTTDPNFWDDQMQAKEVMQEFGDLKKEIEEIISIGKEINTIKELLDERGNPDELVSEVGKVQKRLEKLKLSTFLSEPNDKKNAIISIHAGQGGTEAMDWASMLYRMYIRYCEKRDWTYETLDITEAEEAGIKNASIRVRGSYAYGYLKTEVGTHRLVRQSPFNADRLRQTSFALVEVLPELADADLPDIKIRDDDLSWQFFRASSQGGQNVQKVSTAVRLTHKPTGIVVTAQTERYQQQNRKYALDHLRAKLWAREKAKKEDIKNQIKGEYRPASWGTQIRSYVLHPYKMVKDLRTDVETSDTEAVLNGDLDRFIEAQLRLINEKK